MTTDETKEFFKAMQRAFPADLFFEKIKSDAIGTIRMWSDILEDVQLECAYRFLKAWAKTNQRVPASCDVYQFHKQELIDKRMRIESVQESYINDGENPLLKLAQEAMARINAEKEVKEKAKHPPIDPDELFDTTFSDGFVGKFKRAEIEAMMRNGDPNEHGSVSGIKRKAAEKVEGEKKDV